MLFRLNDVRQYLDGPTQRPAAATSERHIADVLDDAAAAAVSAAVSHIAQRGRLKNAIGENGRRRTLEMPRMRIVGGPTMADFDFIS
jgi:hypothetical protein